MAIKKEDQAQGPKYALIKTSFDLEAAKKNYQLLLQNLAGTTVTRDNVNDDLTKDAREVLKLLEDKKDKEASEPLQWHRDIMAVYNSLRDPLKEQVDRINSQKKRVAQEVDEENRRQLAEQNRINSAKKAIIDFTNKVSGLIVSAKTDMDIVEIEKMIGFEKRRTSLYQEFMPDFEKQVDALRPAIKDQKERIRELQSVLEAEKMAQDNGDIVAQTELLEKKEQIQQEIQESAIRIHETAFDRATEIEIVAPEVVDTAPKGRSNWKWRVDDIKLLQKKMPHLVKLVPDEDAISNLLATKKLDGSLKDKMEENLFGLTFYNDKSYTR